MTTDPNAEETHEDQVFRVLKEMVKNGEITYKEGEDGEIYFSLVEPVQNNL
jgi:polyhydroxyalkanoate synthesis regulator phasin